MTSISAREPARRSFPAPTSTCSPRRSASGSRAAGSKAAHGPPEHALWLDPRVDMVRPENLRQCKESSAGWRGVAAIDPIQLTLLVAEDSLGNQQTHAAAR